MPYRIVKQLKPAPTSSVIGGVTFNDPSWASRNIYVAKLCGSGDQLWEFSGSNAVSASNAKAAELSGSDSTGRLYKVIEI